MTALLTTITGLLSTIIPILILLGVVYFVWGVVQYFIGDSEEAKKKGRDRIIYGIIGLAIIVSLWGVVNIVTSTFDLDNKAPTIDQLAFTNTAATSSLDACSSVDNAAGKLLCNIQNLLNSIVPILMALGLIYFIWGVVQYFIGGGEEAKKKGKDRIIYGIIGFAVIASLWGLVNLLTSSFTASQLKAPDLAPMTTAASTCNLGEGKFQDYLNYATCTINNSVIPFIFAIAVIMFIWGVVKFFILNADEEAKRTQGKQFMIWGIVALAVMLSVWGLVGILRSTFNVKTGTSILPQVQPSK